MPQCGRDGGYDSQAFLDLIRASGAKACIPTPRDRIVQRSVPNRIYRQRNRVERYFCKMKHFRCAATRFDKLARSKLIPRHLSWQRKRTPRVGGKAAGVGRPIRDGLWQRAAYSDRRTRRAATSARNSPVSSTGQRNTYLAITATVRYTIAMSEPIDAQLKKGVLDLCVLELLSQGDSYAYEIASKLAEAIGMGEGTVYPLMRRLSADDLVETYMVESNTGPSRKYYRLTRTGRLALDEQRNAWRSFTKAVDGIVGGKRWAKRA